jgi:hypothetical protein
MKKLLAVFVFAASYAAAASVSYVGNLDAANANDFALFQFTLSIAANVDIQTWGYGGGANAQGAVIAAGGFAPYVSLFQGSGNGATFLSSNAGGLCPPGNPIPACEDATLKTNLAAGTYTVALSVFENMSFAENTGSGTLGDGFVGLGNYYDAASGIDRTPAYALDITSPGIAPEPSSVALVVSAALFLIYTRRRRLRSPRT